MSIMRSCKKRFISIDTFPFFSSSLQRTLHGDVPYFQDHWCQFDAFMVLFHWLSISLQVLQLMEIVSKFSSLSILRSPRPLIMIRFLRVFLKFSMPKSRINQIFK